MKTRANRIVLNLAYFRLEPSIAINYTIEKR